MYASSVSQLHAVFLELEEVCLTLWDLLHFAMILSGKSMIFPPLKLHYQAYSITHCFWLSWQLQLVQEQHFHVNVSFSCVLRILLPLVIENYFACWCSSFFFFCSISLTIVLGSLYPLMILNLKWHIFSIHIFSYPPSKEKS